MGAVIVALFASMAVAARQASACESPDTHACGGQEVSAAEPSEPTVPETPLMFRLEVGVSDDRTWIDAMSGEDEWGQYTGTVASPGVVDARSVTMRVLYGLAGGYGGIEMGVGWLRRAPRVTGTPDPAVWEFLDAEDGPGMGNSLFVARVLGGVEHRIGQVLIGAELALGVGGLTVGDTDIGSPHVNDARFLFDARARFGLWLSPHVSASVLLGTGLVRESDRTVGIMLGVTPFRFDGL